MIKQSETNRENRAETIVWGKVDLGFHMSQASAPRKLRGSVVAMEESFKQALDVEGVLYTLCFSYVRSKDRSKGNEKSLLRLNTLVLIDKSSGSWQGLWQPVEP